MTNQSLNFNKTSDLSEVQKRSYSEISLRSQAMFSTLKSAVCSSRTYQLRALESREQSVYVDDNTTTLAPTSSTTETNSPGEQLDTGNKEYRSRFDVYKLKRKYSSDLVTSGRLLLRDREPSRIPFKQFERIMNKEKKVRLSVRKYVNKTVPKSSKLHECLNKHSKL